MVKNPELVGYLPSNVGPPAELLTDRLLAQFVQDNLEDANILYELEHDGKEHEVESAELKPELGDSKYFGTPWMELPDKNRIDIKFELFKEFPGSDVWDPYIPIVHVYFEGGNFDGMVDFIAVLSEELPICYACVFYDGPYEPKVFPDRGNHEEDIMRSVNVLDVLGPELASEFDRETLLSVPAAEVRELDDGSVLVRAFEDFWEYHAPQTIAIRKHLGLE